MDRKIFKLPFTKEGISRYQCPTCNKGYLKVQDGSFQEKETRSSLLNHGHPNWGPEEVDMVYSCIFVCTNSSCNDVISSSGKGWVEQDYFYDESGQPDYEYKNFFQPELFYPHLKAFTFPKDTPDNVKKEINKSFSLIFTDPPSSANHIRVAIEHLLTHLNINRYSINNGNRYFLSLHKRIDLLPTKYSDIKEIFFAVKWLGNAGSHSKHEVKIDDVLDSYELTIELLDEIFSKKRTKAKSLAKKINRKRGPK